MEKSQEAVSGVIKLYKDQLRELQVISCCIVLLLLMLLLPL